MYGRKLGFSLGNVYPNAVVETINRVRRIKQQFIVSVQVSDVDEAPQRKMPDEFTT